MKALLLSALLLTGCGSGPNDTGISTSLDDQLKIAVRGRCQYEMGAGTTPMSQIGNTRSVRDVAREVCEQVKAGTRTMRDGWGF